MTYKINSKVFHIHRKDGSDSQDNTMGKGFSTQSDNNSLYLDSTPLIYLEFPVQFNSQS
jgi:hypothetical protein